MQRLEVSCAVRPIYGSLSAKGLNLHSTSYPDHDLDGDLPLQGKIPMTEPGIEPRASRLVVRRSDHQATRLVCYENIKL
jgi:hypothetical protein